MKRVCSRFTVALTSSDDEIQSKIEVHGVVSSCRAASLPPGRLERAGHGHGDALHVLGRDARALLHVQGQRAARALHAADLRVLDALYNVCCKGV